MPTGSWVVAAARSCSQLSEAREFALSDQIGVQACLCAGVRYTALPHVLLQASRTELLAELQRLQAVQLGPHWRLVDSAYLGSVLEMLLVR